MKKDGVFMRKKFDAIEYLVKKYVVDEKHAIIPVLLKDREEFFNKYDPTDTALSPEIYEYLDHCINIIPFQYKIEIDVVCNDLNNKYKDLMKDAIKHHYGLKMFECDIDLRNSAKKSIILSVLGTVFVVLAYATNGVNAINLIAGTTMDVLRELLLITGWVFIWSALENYVFERNDLITKKQESSQLFNSTLYFEKEEEYYKELKQEENEDVEEIKEYEEIRDSFLEQ